ncbi:MAG: DUF6249 domain-containing protein [Chthoniobacterales bacterium]
MKTSFLIYLCSLGLALGALGQTPTPSVAATASPVASVSATVSATPRDSDDDDDDIATSVRKKVQRHMGVTVNGHHKDIDIGDPEAAGGIAVAIVGLIFTTLFGAPVLIVAAIMFFSFLKNRALHRTVREMVAKGQPVPPELFAAPGTPAKIRSDIRRGVVLIMVGIGLIVFFGAVNDWEGGAWALGMIPLLIGAGYLLVWKLEGSKKNGINTLRDNTPPVP